MAQVSSFDTTLDADVLVPITLCDTLLRLAEEGFYRPHWSEETLDEIVRNLVRKLNLSQETALERVDHMRAAFSGALARYARVVGKDLRRCLRQAALLRGGAYQKNIGAIYEQVLAVVPEHRFSGTGSTIKVMGDKAAPAVQ